MKYHCLPIPFHKGGRFANPSPIFQKLLCPPVDMLYHYLVNSKQYIAIAAGGVRYGLKPGGSYVAFALP